MQPPDIIGDGLSTIEEETSLAQNNTDSYWKRNHTVQKTAMKRHQEPNLTSRRNPVFAHRETSDDNEDPNDSIIELSPSPLACLLASNINNASLVLLIRPPTISRTNPGDGGGGSSTRESCEDEPDDGDKLVDQSVTSSRAPTLVGNFRGGEGIYSGPVRIRRRSLPRFSFSSRLNLGRLRRVRHANKRERKATKTLAIVLGTT